MRGRLIRCAAHDCYGIVNKVVICSRRDCVCRHGKGDFCLCLVVDAHAVYCPARKLLARFGRVCRDCDGVTVMRGRLIRCAAHDCYGIVNKVVIGGRGDCVCRHCKGDFGFGLVVHGYAFNRPTRELLARCGCVCRDCDGFALGIFAAARAAVDGYGICRGCIVFVLFAAGKRKKRQHKHQCDHNHENH